MPYTQSRAKRARPALYRGSKLIRTASISKTSGSESQIDISDFQSDGAENLAGEFDPGSYSVSGNWIQVDPDHQQVEADALAGTQTTWHIVSPATVKDGYPAVEAKEIGTLNANGDVNLSANTAADVVLTEKNSAIKFGFGPGDYITNSDASKSAKINSVSAAANGTVTINVTAAAAWNIDVSTSSVLKFVQVPYRRSFSASVTGFTAPDYSSDSPETFTFDLTISGSESVVYGTPNLSGLTG